MYEEHRKVLTLSWSNCWRRKISWQARKPQNPAHRQAADEVVGLRKAIKSNEVNQF